LGKRWFTDDNQFILGFYGFYDRRHTELGNKVNQITLGFEAMSETWDYRVNAYCPENAVKEVEKSREVVTETREKYFRGHTEVHVVDKSLRITKTREVSLKGLDLEIGRSTPGFKPLRLYGAYYHFQGRAGAPSISGFRARANLELNKYVSFQFEGSHDKVRKTAGFVGISFRVPLGKQDSKAPPLSDLDKRMTEQPMRDIDIVTSARSMNHEVLETTVDEKPAVFYKGNHPILSEDGYTPPPSPGDLDSGDGSYERPYNLHHHCWNEMRRELAQDLIDNPSKSNVVLEDEKIERWRLLPADLLEKLNRSGVASGGEHGASEISEHPPVADVEELRFELPKKRLVPVGEEGRIRKKLAKRAEVKLAKEAARVETEKREAATAIQTAFKGHKARKELAKLKVDEQGRVAADEQRVRDEEVARQRLVDEQRVRDEAEVVRLAQVENPLCQDSCRLF